MRFRERAQGCCEYCAEAVVRTRTADDCGVGTVDGGESEYVESAVAEIDAGGADCETRTGAGNVVCTQLSFATYCLHHQFNLQCAKVFAFAHGEAQ